MRLLFMNGRHWKIMLIITMQYPLGVPPNLRPNIAYTFILREPYLTNRKRIYENYITTCHESSDPPCNQSLNFSSPPRVAQSESMVNLELMPPLGLQFITMRSRSGS